VSGNRFFVGIGSQKAGTSWLWAYLQTHPGVGFSPVKEMHLFDSKYVPVCSGFNRRFPRIKKYLRRTLTYMRSHPLRGLRFLWHYLGTLAYSEKAYRRFVAMIAEDGKLGGEITPSYAMLDATGIAALENALDRPRYIWIIRNPADRFWSHVRYRARWKDDITGTNELTELLNQDIYKLHSSHKRSYLNWQKVRDDGRLLIIFYEHCFDPATSQKVCDEVCDYLGLPHHPGDRQSKVNVGDTWSAERSAIFNRKLVVETMAEEYRFFDQVFGAALPASWRRDIDSLDAQKGAA
jgi:hypothetical protein